MEEKEIEKESRKTNQIKINMSEKERIEELLHHFRMTAKDFAEKCGFNQQIIADIRREKQRISRQTAKKITIAFPEVDMSWLLYGEEAMLKNSIPIIEISHESKARHLIPLYDDARTIGGTKEVANMDGVSNPTEFIDTGDWFRNATHAIRHYGESMVEYPSGCILALKEVYERQLIIWGKDYMIETNEYRITKRVQRGITEKQIEAYSSNVETYPDGRLMHEPFDVAWKDIRNISMVLGYVVKKNGGTMVYSNSKK
jgi:transcriptional regulator with XRE-family HTH domain